jgi:DNA polymerase-3 subunit epsilon
VSAAAASASVAGVASAPPLQGDETVAVIDFETTGMSPGMGSRATEIAVVLVCGGQIVGRFQSLMNSGAWVPPFIEQFTGISNAMLAQAPPAHAVMREVLQFTRGCPLVAHNAAFDRSFWQAETALAGADADPAHAFACTLLLARRLYPQAPNHRLGTLADFHHLPRSGRAHRALADAEVTAHLLLQMQQDVQARYGAALGPVALTHRHLCELQRTPKAQLARCFLSPAPRQKARLRARLPA